MVKVKDQKSAVIYARVSSVGDRQSTDRQVADLQHFARLNGYKVTQVFTEHISGAKKNEERAVLCECLAYCFQEGIDTLLISELSRLGRNVDEVLANVRLCKERKLNIFFQKEGLSTFQADGTPNPFLNIFIAVLGTCAEMERENSTLMLQLKREQLRSEIDALKTSNRQMLFDEIERREKMTQARLEWELAQDY